MMTRTVISPQTNTYGKRIPLSTKRVMALSALRGKQTVATISKTHGCSRTTVYKQHDKALAAANKVFESDDDTASFHFPVTKDVIKKIVTALVLICKSSYRDCLSFLKSIFDYSLSLGSVFSIIEECAEKAAPINQSYDLKSIKTSAADEIFHRNKPFLATVDIDSRFCPLLVKADARDYETWGIHLLDLESRGYAPDTAILDGAKGLVKGHAISLPGTTIRHDHFHILKDLKDCGRFLSNKEASQATAALCLYRKVEAASAAEKKKEITGSLSSALANLTLLEKTRASFSLLVQWLQHDVLQLAGHPPKERALLYDFIVSEMMALSVQHPHRLSEIVTSLVTRRDALLDVANTLNEAFCALANKYTLSVSIIWEICYTARYDANSVKYGLKSCALESLIGPDYDAIEDEVLLILEGTHRCSSMVENFNSRLRPYLDEKKEVTQKTLDLVQFYLNHKPFVRSHHKHLVNKTPAEALTGVAHKPWLEMLGFTEFQRQAA